MAPVVITPPASIAPALLPLVKKQVRVEHDDDDVLLSALIDAAVDLLDGPGGELGRCLLPQTLELRLESFNEDHFRFGAGYAWTEGTWSDWTWWPFSRLIKLPDPPLISVTSIIYEDINGADQTLSSAGWKVAGDSVEAAWGMPWPSGRVEANAVRIQYQAGYPLAAPVGEDPAQPTFPAKVRHAILLLVSHWYAHPDAVVGVENRDSSTQLPIGVERLLEPIRVYRT